MNLFKCLGGPGIWSRCTVRAGVPRASVLGP